MGHADEGEVERTEAEAAAGLDDGDLGLVDQLRFAQLAAQHRGSEGRGVDRAAQLRPEPGDGADMVFMRVRDHEAGQPVPPLGDIGRVGDHDVHFRVFRAAEPHAAIHREPSVGTAVEVEVHADLAGAAQGQKGQIRSRCVHASPSIHAPRAQ